MPVKRHSRVKLNRKAVDQVRLILADGVMAVAKEAINTTDPPDAPPYHEGLVRSGGALAFVGKKKIDGWSQDGTQPKKPRSVKLGNDDAITGVAGWSRPARFDEFGTVNQRARPFFTPAVQRLIPRIPGIMRQATAYRLKRLR